MRTLATLRRYASVRHPPSQTQRRGVDCWSPRDDDAAIAAITVTELWVGLALRSGRRRDARGAFVDRVVAVLPVVDYDLTVAEAHTSLLVYREHRAAPTT